MFVIPGGFQQVYVCIKSEYMTVAVCYFISLGQCFGAGFDTQCVC